MNNGLNLLANGVLAHNLILFQGLGLYALLRYTKTVNTAVKAAVAMLATTFTACIIAEFIQPLIPVSFAMNLPLYFVIALVSGLLWHRLFEPLLGNNADQSLLTAFVNSALVGLLLNMSANLSDGESLLGYGFAGALGYGLVLIVMAGIRERLELTNVPKAFKGVPILLISAAILGFALMGYRL